MGESKDANDEDINENVQDKNSHDVPIIVTHESSKDHDERAKEDQGTNDRHVVLTPKRRLRMFFRLTRSRSRTGNSNRSKIHRDEYC